MSFDRLSPGDIFVATNEYETALVPMKKCDDGKTAYAYGLGGENRFGAIELWAEPEKCQEFPANQPVIKLKITPK